MKLEICVLEDSNIVLNVDNDAIEWTQRTLASVVWASKIAAAVSSMFREYKLAGFTFNSSKKGGYDVAAKWTRTN